MIPLLFVLFVTVPIAEIAVLLVAGRSIGPLPTLGLVLATAAVGSALAVRAWRSSWREFIEVVQAGQEPTRPLLSALLVGAGGLLLLTPGFLTDLVGLSLLFRPLRTPLVEALRSRLLSGVRLQGPRPHGGSPPDTGPGRQQVEVVDITESPPPPDSSAPVDD